MAYKYSKGEKEFGDIEYENDPRATQIDLKKLHWSRPVALGFVFLAQRSESELQTQTTLTGELKY